MLHSTEVHKDESEEEKNILPVHRSELLLVFLKPWKKKKKRIEIFYSVNVTMYSIKTDEGEKKLLNHTSLREVKEKV